MSSQRFLLILLLSKASLLSGCFATWENDRFAPRNYDEDYTNGLRLGSVWKSSESLSLIPGLQDPSPIKNSQYFNSISLGQTFYTPGKLEDKDLIVDDRPYAGYLFTGIAEYQIAPPQLDTWNEEIKELRVGLVGPGAGAKKVQQWVHEQIGSTDPKGWTHQLDNEPTAQYFYGRARSIGDPCLLSPSYFIYDVGLGNVWTYASLSLAHRLNLLSGSPTRRGIMSLGMGQLAPAAAALMYQGNEKENSLSSDSDDNDLKIYLDFLGTARLVAYDKFLDGNLFSDSHRIDKNYGILEPQLKVNIEVSRWLYAYTLSLRTPQMQDDSSPHIFGGLSASYLYGR
jgi:hypothetical protein